LGIFSPYSENSIPVFFEENIFILIPEHPEKGSDTMADRLLLTHNPEKISFVKAGKILGEIRAVLRNGDACRLQYTAKSMNGDCILHISI
jgi:hypothetical protein